jgi:delta-aminolevulinic acid dehydratase/porphobilinogen synthase
MLFKLQLYLYTYIYKIICLCVPVKVKCSHHDMTFMILCDDIVLFSSAGADHVACDSDMIDFCCAMLNVMFSHSVQILSYSHSCDYSYIREAVIP